MWILVCALLLAIGGLVVVSAYKRRVVNVATVNQGVDEFYDFLAGPEPLVTTLGGSGQLGGSIGVSDHPGYFPGGISVNVQSAGDSVAFLSANTTEYLLHHGSSDIQARLSPAQDLDQPISAANYQRQGAFGFFKKNAGTAIEGGTARGAYFYYNGLISDNWICKVVSASATSTFITDHEVEYEDLYLRIIVNPSQTFFYIQNVLVYTATQGGIALTNEYIQFGFKDYKVDTGAAVGACYDAIKIVQKLTTPRQFAAVT